MKIWKNSNPKRERGENDDFGFRMHVERHGSRDRRRRTWERDGRREKRAMYLLRGCYAISRQRPKVLATGSDSRFRRHHKRARTSLNDIRTSSVLYSPAMDSQFWTHSSRLSHSMAVAAAAAVDGDAYRGVDPRGVKDRRGAAASRLKKNRESDSGRPGLLARSCSCCCRRVGHATRRSQRPGRISARRLTGRTLRDGDDGRARPTGLLVRPSACAAAGGAVGRSEEDWRGVRERTMTAVDGHHPKRADRHCWRLTRPWTLGL